MLLITILLCLASRSFRFVGRPHENGFTTDYESSVDSKYFSSRTTVKSPDFAPLLSDDNTNRSLADNFSLGDNVNVDSCSSRDNSNGNFSLNTSGDPDPGVDVSLDISGTNTSSSSAIIKTDGQPSQSVPLPGVKAIKRKTFQWKKTLIACTNCQRAKGRCDKNRPCGRCVRTGKPNCVDRPPTRRTLRLN